MKTYGETRKIIRAEIYMTNRAGAWHGDQSRGVAHGRSKSKKSLHRRGRRAAKQENKTDSQNLLT